MNSFNSIVEYYSQKGYEGVQLDRKAMEVCREIAKIKLRDKKVGDVAALSKSQRNANAR